MSYRHFASRSSAARRAIVLGHQPGWQAAEDWWEVARRIVAADPTTCVYVVDIMVKDERLAEQVATLPTLYMSPGPLRAFRILHGKVYHGRQIHKFDQARLLHEGGARVPNTTMLRPDIKLDEAVWGEFVVVKPSDPGATSKGIGVNLVRTSSLSYRAPADYPKGHPGAKSSMIVQSFIDTGPFVTNYRLLTCLGQPLYLQRATSNVAITLQGSDDDIEALPVDIQAHPHRERELIYDADIVALGALCYRAIPDVPVQGIDIVRHHRTGKLFVLELNPGGNTWHFSSSFMKPFRDAAGPEYVERQRTYLDAFGTVAHALIQKAHLEAC